MGSAMSHVVVLLGSRLADLERHGTRWRSVLTRWAVDPRVRQLTVVDFPRFGRHLGVTEQDSWLDGARSLGLRVPGPVGGWPLDLLGWAAAGRALRTRVEADDVLAVAATPLSTRLLPRLGARRTGFDAVDDWRALPSVQAAAARVVDGYRAAARADVVTAVSDVLGARLQRDFGLDAVTVGNAVEPADAGDGTGPAGLPDQPFAVYVGTVQERVDLALVGAVAERMPVVVAGPATASQAERLRAMPVTWLGPVPVGQVPVLLSQAAVGLLPHTIDALTESMAPMKLLEYVAAGLPVVSTALPEVERQPRVRVGESPSEFADLAVALAAEGRQPPSPAWLDENSWDRVADRLLTLLVGGST